jgi:hypothetical protein
MGRVFIPNAIWIILVFLGIELFHFGVRTFRRSKIFAWG